MLRAAPVFDDEITQVSCGVVLAKYLFTDTQGEQLNGNAEYAITFLAGQLPPVQGFWSLTLYNEHHLFYSNPLRRYSLGTKNSNLQRDANGSLTLYASAMSPGKDKESHWLPGPKAS